MTTIVARNTIKLATSASGADDYYNNYKIILTRTNSVGKKTVQEKTIIDYIGSTKMATIDGLWEDGYHPMPGDTYQIVPLYGDGRVSINPAIQSADYITSKSYGRGLDAKKDLKLDTWLESARICDTRSDVYVKFTGTAPEVGATYVLGSAGIWQGTVAEVIGAYIRFTDIIGKLAYMWNNWRDYPVGVLVHHKERLYEVTTAGVKTTEPIHTSGTTAGMLFLSAKNITKTSGTGPSTIPLAVDGNPIRWEKNGVPVSGYTLYDSDGIDYFRLIGWDVNEQRSVTRHQTNISIDTSLPLFDNMNSLLQHFGGILRYTADKYVLEVEQMEGGILNSADEPRNITSDHIIGRISISDDGIKNAFNSVTSSYSDPSNKFEARNISFFNSNYLKADRNVPKKGSITIPGISNYYNARLLSDKFLTKSRYGLSISMNLAPRGQLLLAGKVIQLQYPRYGWVDKKFRIENITFNDDCSVDVVANEYDDSFYVVSNISKAPAIGLAGTSANTTLDAPADLNATGEDEGNELVSAIELSWVDSPAASSPNVITQIYASYSPNLTIVSTGVTTGSVFNSVAHGMLAGQRIVSDYTGNGLTQYKTYYVKTVTADTFTLSETKDGTTLSVANTTDDYTFITATVIGEVRPPTTSFIDNVFDYSGARVEKYYWIRYKVNIQ